MWKNVQPVQMCRDSNSQTLEHDHWTKVPAPDFIFLIIVFKTFKSTNFARLLMTGIQLLNESNTILVKQFNHLALQQKEMSNWICPTVKHLWNDTVFVLRILFGFVINATADHLGPHSLHLLLLHGLAFRKSVNLYSERGAWQSAKKTCFCEQQEMYERHILPVTYCKRF